jgi:hypothetical protein
MRNPTIPIPVAQFEEIVAICRDLDRESKAAKLVPLTIRKA